MKKRFLGIALLLGLSSAVLFAQEETTGTDSTRVKTDLFVEATENDSIKLPIEELKFACSAKKDTTETEKAELFACTAKKDTTETEKAELFACTAKKDTTETAPEKAELFAQETESESTEIETPTEEKAELFAQETESEPTEVETPTEEKVEMFA